MMCFTYCFDYFCYFLTDIGVDRVSYDQLIIYIQNQFSIGGPLPVLKWGIM